MNTEIKAALLVLALLLLWLVVGLLVAPRVARGLKESREALERDMWERERDIRC